ncbi:NAD(P)H-dependent oxidoreductase [Gordonibacter urolithinfaciens]|uniref:NAD(P)H-dependent oxidoreductase n=1 Tax=Gordonibacter urolithinfaciens TaxID=1335613 RepID=UPI0022B25A36|nr:NAD(P)H-dependent oxidoreductase [Gordonibacter urolithinfaciens]
MYARWNEADMLVLASPVYYGSFSGQLHCAIHRTYALGVPERARTSAAPELSMSAILYAASERIYHGFIQGYFGAEDCGVFTAAGAENRSSAKLEELRAFGRSL